MGDGFDSPWQANEITRCNFNAETGVDPMAFAGCLSPNFCYGSKAEIAILVKSIKSQLAIMEHG